MVLVPEGLERTPCGTAACLGRWHAGMSWIASESSVHLENNQFLGPSLETDSLDSRGVGENWVPIRVSDLQPDLRILRLDAFGFFPVLRFHQDHVLSHE